MTASSEGHEPSTKLVEVSMNHEEHKEAPVLKFQLEKVNNNIYEIYIFKSVRLRSPTIALQKDCN